MIEDDVIYYEQRAEAELELAQRATDAEAVQAHYDKATAYLDLIHGGVSDVADSRCALIAEPHLSAA